MILPCAHPAPFLPGRDAFSWFTWGSQELCAQEAGLPGTGLFLGCAQREFTMLVGHQAEGTAGWHLRLADPERCEAFHLLRQMRGLAWQPALPSALAM